VAGAAEERSKHWAELDERGANWGPGVLAFIYRTLGRTACLVVLAPVILYFYVFGTQQRRASLAYLRRVWAVTGRAGRPNHLHSLRHFFAFGVSLVDKFGAWIGQIDRENVDAIDGEAFNAMRRDPRGAVIMSAHVGTTEIVRAIASRHQRRRINVVIHTKNARRYNALIERFAPQSRVSLLEVSEFSISAAVELSAAIERGEWVVVMGDRMPLRQGADRTVPVDFLGAPAPFPQGPFILAAALRCPIYLLFCYRAQARYRVQVELLTDGVQLPRRNRMAALKSIVERYAATLETLVKAAPYQWFNFYDFWAPPDLGAGRPIE
jgi:predicted LPLAT superfamily acyltransferase